MDWYAKACPTCGRPRDPFWISRALRAEEEHDARRQAHFILITLLIAGLIATCVALRPGKVSTEAEVCRTASALSLSILANTGPYGAFTEKYAGEVESVNRLNTMAPAFQDQELRTLVEAVVTSARETGKPFPALGDLLDACRAKNYGT